MRPYRVLVSTRTMCCMCWGASAIASPDMQAKTGRQTNKVVPLPLEGSQALSDAQGPAVADVRRPIHVYLTAGAFDLKKLSAALKTRYRGTDVHPSTECVHCRVNQPGLASEPDDGYGELFFFEVCLPFDRVDSNRIAQTSAVQSSPHRQLMRDATVVLCSMASAFFGGWSELSAKRS